MADEIERFKSLLDAHNTLLRVRVLEAQVAELGQACLRVNERLAQLEEEAREKTEGGSSQADPLWPLHYHKTR